jgi:hypothetical protein
MLSAIRICPAKRATSEIGRYDRKRPGTQEGYFRLFPLFGLNLTPGASWVEQLDVDRLERGSAVEATGLKQNDDGGGVNK